MRQLNQPRPLKVLTGEGGRPIAVVLGGQRLAVSQVQDVWRVDDEWWRKEVSRLYYRLLLEDGRVWTLYRDLTRDQWYKQDY